MTARSLLTSSASRAILSFGVAQGVGAVAAVLRIPLAVSSLGAHDFGALSILTATFLWLNVLPTGARQTGRILVSEGSARSAKDLELVGSIDHGDRLSRRILLVGVVAIIGLLVVAQDLAHADAAAATGVVLLLFATQIPGSAALGVWEGQGRLAITNLLAAAFAVISLVMSVLAHDRTDDLALWTFVFALPLVGPAWVAYGVTMLGRIRRQRYGRGEQLFRRSSRIIATQQLQNGVDPYLIAAALGPVAVGEYNIAQRLSILLLLLPTSLQPVFIKLFGESRGDVSGHALRGKQIRFSAGLAIVTACLSVPFVAFSGDLASVVGAGVVDVPPQLFIAVAVQCTIFAWQVPVFAALTGREGNRIVSRSLPVAVAVNLSLSLALVSHGVWGTTVASVMVSAGYNVWLHLMLRRNPELLESRHID